jgi:YbbR domain-containing protein
VAYHPFRHLGLKFLSILLAASIWLLVADQQLVERSVRAPLEFHNMPAGFELVNDPPDSVEVRLRGSSGLLGRLAPGDVVAVLNLQAARTGTRLLHVLADEVRVPYGVHVAQVTPSSVALTFEATGTRLVPVVPAIEGDPAPGFAAGRVTADPPVVEIVGPLSLLQELKSATTEPVVISKATRTVQDKVTVGVRDDKVRLREPKTALVTVEVVPAASERTLAAVRVVAQNGAADRRVEIDPVTVRMIVHGSSEALAALDGGGALRPHVDLTGLAPGRYTLPVQVDAATIRVEVVRIEPTAVDVRIW